MGRVWVFQTWGPVFISRQIMVVLGRVDYGGVSEGIQLKYSCAKLKNEQHQDFSQSIRGYWD